MGSGTASWNYICETFGRAYLESENNVTATRCFLVKLWPTPEISEALDVPGLPVIGDLYISDVHSSRYNPNLRCARLTPEEVDKEQGIYRVKAEYEIKNTRWSLEVSSRAIEFEPQQYATVVPSFGARPVVLQKDKYIVPTDANEVETMNIINTVGDPFKPSVKGKKYQLVFTLTKEIDAWADIDPDDDSSDYSDEDITDLCTFTSFVGKVNDEAFYFAGCYYDKWTLLVEDINIVKMSKANGDWKAKIKLTLVYDEKTHANLTLNAGFNYKPTGAVGEAAEAIYDTKQGSKTPIEKPLLINGEIALPGTYDDENGPPFYLIFLLYSEKDFSKLGLPAAWIDVDPA